MDNKLLNKISYGEKKHLVSKTLLIYAKMDKMKSSTEIFSEGACDVVRSRIASNIRGASIIETIFKLLPPDQLLVLENDFIKKSEPEWYLKNWSKGTYYKLKHEAIDQFLYYLYD